MDRIRLEVLAFPEGSKTEMKYQIAAAARLSNLSVDTIRAWERRYEIVKPERGEARARLYSDGDVARLSLARMATQLGHPIRRVAKLTNEELEALIRKEPAGHRTVHGGLVDKVIAAVHENDAVQAEQVLISPRCSFLRANSSWKSWRRCCAKSAISGRTANSRFGRNISYRPSFASLRRSFRARTAPVRRWSSQRRRSRSTSSASRFGDTRRFHGSPVSCSARDAVHRDRRGRSPAQRARRRGRNDASLDAGRGRDELTVELDAKLEPAVESGSAARSELTSPRRSSRSAFAASLARRVRSSVQDGCIMLAMNGTAAARIDLESVVAQIETMRAAPQRELSRIEDVLRRNASPRTVVAARARSTRPRS